MRFLEGIDTVKDLERASDLLPKLLGQLRGSPVSFDKESDEYRLRLILAEACARLCATDAARPQILSVVKGMAF